MKLSEVIKDEWFSKRTFYTLSFEELEQYKDVLLEADELKGKNLEILKRDDVKLNKEFTIWNKTLTVLYVTDLYTALVKLDDKLEFNFHVTLQSITRAHGSAFLRLTPDSLVNFNILQHNTYLNINNY